MNNPVQPAPSEDHARALHEAAIVVDGHNDLAWRIREHYGLDLDAIRLDHRLEEGHTDLPRLREGGVDVQFWAAYVPPSFGGSEAARIAREQIDLIHRLIRRYPRDLEFATGSADIDRITAQGRIASLIGVEGGHAIDGSLDILREFYRSGARYLTLTHTASTEWADAAGDVSRAGGLSEFGCEVIAEMNRLGMIVDISHVADETMHDVLDTTTAPVIFSHSSARALADHPRNVPDDVLERMPENGGVVMVNFFSGFLTERGARTVAHLFADEERIRARHRGSDAYLAARSEWLASLVETRGTVATIVDHIDHIVDRAGIPHVGLGSDFDGMPVSPEGMEDVSCFPAVTEELVRRGYGDEDVKAVLGGNALRVLGDVERAAANADF